MTCTAGGVGGVDTVKKNELKGVAKEVTGKDIVKNLLKYCWPRGRSSEERAVKCSLITSLLLMVASKVANTAVPYIFSYAVDELTGEAGPEAAAPAVILGTLACYGAARAMALGCQELRNAVFARVAQHSIRNIAQNVFLHLHKLDLSFHLNRQTGALSKTIDRGSRAISFVLSSLVFNVVPTILELAIVSAVLAVECGLEYTAVALLTVGLYSAFTFAFTEYRNKFRIMMNEADNEAGNKAVDSLINYETVKYFNNEVYEAGEYDKHLAKYEKASLRTTQTLAALNFGQNFIFSAALAGIMMMAARDILGGHMSVGHLVMVNGLLFQISVPLGFLGSVWRELRQALIDMQVMFQLMTVEPKMSTEAVKPPLKISDQTSNIVFENVSFSYVCGQQILDNLSFEVPAGQRYAIVGGSGSGKSTVIRLLYRFYSPKSGSVRIGGRDINSLDLASVRRSISVVPQDCVLFHNTIRHNIGYGNLGAPAAEVESAANMAELHTSILEWPSGYDTQVGERGLKLSGGEKQRVAIARAILKNSPILVFDEATSSLDSITENSIMRALNKATEGRTSIIIAHRLSTVVNCDKILVMDKGRVAEAGRHEDLVSDEDSIYFRLWRSQNTENIGHPDEVEVDVPEMPRSRSSTISDKSILQPPGNIKDPVTDTMKMQDDEEEAGESAPLISSESGREEAMNKSSSGVSSLNNSAGSSETGANLV